MATFSVSIDNSEVKDDTLDFVISGQDDYGLDKSIVNSLRRTLMTEIPCVGFRVEEGTRKDIHIEINNSSLHNEFLMHRISLIPLYLNPEEYEQQYLFYLNVKHDSKESFKFITTDDIQILPLRKDVNLEEVEMSIDNYDFTKPLSKQKHAEIFRPFTFRGKAQPILITELKATDSEDKIQEIVLYGVPSESDGREHARWKCVSKAVYSYLENEELFKSVAEDKASIAKIIDDEDKEKFIQSLYLSEGERYYWRDSNDEPFKYNFSITSVNYYRPKELFIKTNELMIEKLETFKEHFINMVKGGDTTVLLEPCDKENVYKFKVCGQNDTLGNVVQSHIVNHFIDEKSLVNFCGYKKSHPLEEYITFTFALNPSNKTFGKSEESKLNAIIKYIDEVISDVVKHYELIIDEANKSL